MNNKVHFIHFQSSPGGIEVLLARTIKYSGISGYNAFVIRPPRHNDNHVYTDTGLQVSYGSSNNLIAAIRLFRYCLKNKSDIFHLFNTGPYFLIVIRFAGVKHLVYSIRGTKYWKNNAQKVVRRLFWRMALTKKIKLISNSLYSRRMFLRNIDSRAEIEVIYNPVGDDKLRFSFKRPTTGELKILYTGRLTRSKNLEKWIDLACRIHCRLENTVFEIYGSGPLEEELRSRIILSGAQDYIFLKGFRSDIEEVYRSADLMLFLSEYESFGNVVVESVLCGTPVMAADIPSMKEIFLDYPMFLVPAGEEMFEQICDRIMNYDLLLGEVRKAAEDFSVRFSLKNHIKRLGEIYNEL